MDKTGDFHAILPRVVQGEIVPPEQRAPERARKIPLELSAVAMKALARDKKDRYATVEALRRDIELYLEGRSVSAREDTRREMLWKFVKRNKGFSAGLAMTMVVVICSLGFLTKAWLATNQAYADYRQAQEDKRSQAKQSVPAFVRAARLAINERQFEDALAQVNAALEFDTDNVEARLLRAQLRIVRQEYAEASTELRECLRRRPNDGDAQRLANLCERAKKDDAATLLAFAEVFERSRAWRLADATTAGLGKTSLEARKKLLRVYRQRIETAWKGLGERLTISPDDTFSLNFENCTDLSDLSPLEGMPLTNLSLFHCNQVRDLSPLKGMPLTNLNLFHCVQVRDLSPLKGMPLTTLDLDGCDQVSDLSPLKGMSLTWLNLFYCVQVRDLSPLKGMPLNRLNLGGCGQVRDLSLLKGMPLAEIAELPPRADRGTMVLREIKTLKKINGIPATEFWKKYDAGEFKQYKP